MTCFRTLIHCFNNLHFVPNAFWVRSARGQPLDIKSGCRVQTGLTWCQADVWTFYTRTESASGLELETRDVELEARRMNSLQKSQRTLQQGPVATVVMSLTLLALGLLGSSSISKVAGSSMRIQHANSYAIKSVADENCLTATRHTFRAGDGVFVGEVLTSQCFSLTYQYWDAIRWKDVPKNQFWLYPKSASLNELTTVPDAELARASASGGGAGQAGQTQNLVEIRYVPNAKGAFLIRSTILGKCVQANGAELRISYETCDFAVREQQWTAEPLVQVDTNSFKC